MSAKEYLSRFSKLDAEMEVIREMILVSRTRLERMSPVISDMPKAGNGNADKMAEGISRIMELEERLGQQLNNLEIERRDTIRTINMLDNPAYRIILLDRYFNMKTFEQISTLLNYSYYYTCKLHGYALMEFDKIRMKEYKT